MTYRTALAALALLAAATGAGASDSERARNLAATCANCHGTNGSPAAGTAMDPLAGRDRSWTLNKLNGFKDGTQQATIMHQIVKGYSDEQLELIATYFAMQTAGGAR
ncbi:MAG: cytochrome C [Betaproteobacteria bacterium]|nr:cytochrome C [Betaproteobacteria bacterium]